MAAKLEVQPLYMKFTTIQKSARRQTKSKHGSALFFQEWRGITRVLAYGSKEGGAADVYAFCYNSRDRAPPPKQIRKMSRR